QVRWVVLRAVAVRKAVLQGRWAVPQAEALRARWAEALRAAVRQVVPQARWVVPRAVARLASGALARWVGARKVVPLRERWGARREPVAAKREPRVTWAAHKVREALPAAWPVVVRRQLAVPPVKVARKAA